MTFRSRVSLALLTTLVTVAVTGVTPSGRDAKSSGGITALQLPAPSTSAAYSLPLKLTVTTISGTVVMTTPRTSSGWVDSAALR